MKIIQIKKNKKFTWIYFKFWSQENYSNKKTIKIHVKNITWNSRKKLHVKFMLISFEGSREFHVRHIWLCSPVKLTWHMSSSSSMNIITLFVKQSFWLMLICPPPPYHANNHCWAKNRLLFFPYPDIYSFNWLPCTYFWQSSLFYRGSNMLYDKYCFPSIDLQVDFHIILMEL